MNKALPDPTSLAGRLLALGVLFIGVVIAWFFLVAPIIGNLAELNIAVKNAQATLAAFQHKAAFRTPRSDNSRGYIPKQLTASLVTNQAPGRASLSIQSDVRQIGTRHGAQLRMLQVLPTKKIPDIGFEEIPIRVNAAIQYPQLVDILFDLQQHRPGIFAEKLTIRAPESLRRLSGSHQSAQITLDMELYVLRETQTK